jgi:hypothetical protein
MEFPSTAPSSLNERTSPMGDRSGVFPWDNENGFYDDDWDIELDSDDAASHAAR